MTNKERRGRLLDYEPDTATLIPTAPDYIVVGTYHLVQDDDRPEELKAADPRKEGTLEIIPFCNDESNDSILYRMKFRFGIVYIHFHPIHTCILGVTTSDGRFMLFEVCFDKDDQPKARRPTHLARRGWTQVCNEYISQFHFFTGNEVIGSSDPRATISAVVCDGSGQVHVVDLQVSAQVDGSDTGKKHVLIHRHQFDLQAWSIYALPRPDISDDRKEFLIISGGDDSCLLASSYSHRLVNPGGTQSLGEPDAAAEVSDGHEYTVRLEWTDKRRHESGITSLLRLSCKIPMAKFPSTPSAGAASNVSTINLFLTGTYSNILRVFSLSHSRFGSNLSLLLEHDFNDTMAPNGASSSKEECFETAADGAVWKIDLLDSYQDVLGTTTHFILLLAMMRAGAAVVRLTVSSAGTAAAATTSAPPTRTTTTEFPSPSHPPHYNGSIANPARPHPTTTTSEPSPFLSPNVDDHIPNSPNAIATSTNTALYATSTVTPDYKAADADADTDTGKDTKLDIKIKVKIEKRFVPRNDKDGIIYACLARRRHEHRTTTTSFTSTCCRSDNSDAELNPKNPVAATTTTTIAKAENGEGGEGEGEGGSSIERGRSQNARIWDIVGFSFYERTVSNWEWVDDYDHL